MMGLYVRFRLVGFLVGLLMPIAASAWQVGFGSPDPGSDSRSAALLFDSTGDIVSVGAVEGVMTAIRLSSQGTVQWTGEPFSDRDGFGAALALTSTGELAVGGEVAALNIVGNSQVAAALVNQGTGQAVWTDVDPGTQAHSAAAILVDSADGIVVGGRASGPGNSSRVFAVHKVSGQSLWETSVAPDPVNGEYPSGQVTSMALGAGDEIIAAGRTHTLEARGDGLVSVVSSNLLVVKLDNATGAVLWSTKLSEPSSGYDVATDGNGDVYVGGAVSDDGSTFGGDDFAVIKLAGSDGSEIWRYVIDDPGWSGAVAAVLLDDLGNVYAGGLVDLGGFAAPGGVGEMTVVKLNGETGSAVWTTQISNELAFIPDELIPGVKGLVYALAADAAGNVVAGGVTNASWISSGVGPSRDFTVAKLDRIDGDVHWIHNFGMGEARDVQVHASGLIAASGSTEHSPRHFSVIGFSDLLSGKSLVLSDNTTPSRRSLKLTVRDQFLHAPTPGTAGDPTVHGATLFLRETTSGAERVLALPAEHWQLRRGQRYVFKNKTGSTACSKATLRAGKLIVRCRGSELDLPSAEGPLSIVVAELALGTRGGRVCTRFGGDVRRNDGTAFDARNAPRPAACSAF